MWQRSRVSEIEISVHRCVVGCGQSFLFLTEIPVYDHVIDPCGDGFGAQDEVDAQTMLAMKGTTAIIPPGKKLLVRVAGTKEVRQSQRHEPAETCPFRLCVKNVAIGGGTTPAVQWRGYDVEIAA